MYNGITNAATVIGKQADMDFKMSGDIMQVVFAKASADPEKVSSVALECLEKDHPYVLYAPSNIDLNQVVRNNSLMSHL